MSPPPGDDVTQVVVVATDDSLVRTRATVRSAHSAGHASCLVVDVDGSYVAVGSERVLPVREVADRLDAVAELAAAAATLAPAELAVYAGVLGACDAAARGVDGVLVLAAGVHVLGDLAGLAGPGGSVDGGLVLPLADPADVGARAAASEPRQDRDAQTGLVGVEAPDTGPLLDPSLFVVRSAQRLTVLRALAADWRTAPTALDVVAATTGIPVADAAAAGAVLVGPRRTVDALATDAHGRACVGDEPVTTLDLHALDPRTPWLLDATARTMPRVRLSDHPVLARLVQEEATARLADEASLAGPPDVDAEPAPMSAPDRSDPILRSEARRAHLAGGQLPDVLGLGPGPDLETWALAEVPAGDPSPVARYLAAVWAARPDLQEAFPRVPGPDADALARWARRSGMREPGHDAELLRRAAAATRARLREVPAPAPSVTSEGVNLIGYLAGELGLGVSARLVDSALQAVGVPTSTLDVGRSIQSRQGAAYRRSEPVRHPTSLLCVNAADTLHLAPRLGDVLRGTRVIGMWYWELEEFPATYDGAFAHVDEVWVATEFMRHAVSARAGDTPVRTVMPPLPQAGTAPPLPTRFGIPAGRPWFLFTFDYFSVAERKNPRGLVEAFTRAFQDRAADRRPTLVLKTINAERDPSEAERLRLLIAGRADVVLVEEYLANDERHALVAHCTAYVSLHRAEGLGLTVAEAMAWGKPVIATAYGGVTDFCTAENSFPVNWGPTAVTETVGPYREGMVWADPDLDHAAALMRSVVDDPARAEAVGRQAAADIRDRHSPAVAGAHIRTVLAEGDARWRAARAEEHERSGPAPDPDTPPGGLAARAAGVAARQRARASAWRRERG